MTVHKKTLQIAIPTFNRKETVYKQVKGLLDDIKHFNQMSILVSDNGSDDGTLELLSSIGDDRLKLVWKEKNEGYQANFIHLCEFITSDYVVFLSDEDYIDISVMHDFLKEFHAQDFNFVSSNIVADGKKYRNIKKNREIRASEYWKSSHYLSGLVFSVSIVEDFLRIYRTLDLAKYNIYPQVILASHAIANGKSYWLGRNLAYPTTQLNTTIPHYTSFSNRLRQYYEVSDILKCFSQHFYQLPRYRTIIQCHEDRAIEWLLPAVFKNSPVRAVLWVLKSIFVLLKLTGLGLYESSSKHIRRN